MATTTSRSCSSFWNFGASAGPSKVRTSSSSSSSHGGGKLDGVAMWLINGVTTAFFASLERCSCIRVNTVEDADDINEIPLIYNDGNVRHYNNGGSSSMMQRGGQGRKRRASYNE